VFKIKILLINPNPLPDSISFGKNAVPPIGLLYIAAVLEREKFEVSVIDAFLLKLNHIELSRKIIKHKADIVGITSESVNYYESLRIAKTVKNVSKAVVVLGGPHASIKPMDLIQYPEVDIVVIGEGEFTMLEIVQRIKNGQSFDGCKGTVFKKDGEIIVNPLRERIEDLDSIPYPARHLVPIKAYPRNYTFGGMKIPVDTITTSRGCPYSCSFCSSRMIWGRIYKTRDPKSVVDEIEFLIKNYGTKSFYFVEDNFTLKKKHVMGICDEIIKRKLKIEWECYSRVDLVNKEILEKIHKAGCKAIWYGIESGSPKTLERLDKGITLEQSRNACKMAKNAGLKVGGSFMIRLPGETKEDIIMTYNFIKELALNPTSLALFRAIPDSQMYQEVVEKGMYDASYGDIYFVKLPGISRNYLSEILMRVEKEIPALIRRDNIKRDPLFILKYFILSLKEPYKIKRFIKNLIKR